MRNVMLILALMGCVYSGTAQTTKKNPAKSTQDKTITASDKPVFTYKKNNIPVKSTAAIKDDAELISFSSEGTFIARYPKAATPKLASK